MESSLIRLIPDSYLRNRSAPLESGLKVRRKLLLTGGSQQEGSKDSLEGIGKNFGIVQEGVEVSTLPDLEGEESGQELSILMSTLEFSKIHLEFL